MICGVAPNSTALIIGRAVAGVGAAGIFSGAILIIASTVPLRQRPAYMGLIGGMYGIASVAGPLVSETPQNCGEVELRTSEHLLTKS